MNKPTIEVSLSEKEYVYFQKLFMRASRVVPPHTTSRAFDAIRKGVEGNNHWLQTSDFLKIINDLSTRA